MEKTASGICPLKLFEASDKNRKFGKEERLESVFKKRIPVAVKSSDSRLVALEAAAKSNSISFDSRFNGQRRSTVLG